MGVFRSCVHGPVHPDEQQEPHEQDDDLTSPTQRLWVTSTVSAFSRIVISRPTLSRWRAGRRPPPPRSPRHGPAPHRHLVFDFPRRFDLGQLVLLARTRPFLHLQFSPCAAKPSAISVRSCVLRAEMSRQISDINVATQLGVSVRLMASAPGRRSGDRSVDRSRRPPRLRLAGRASTRWRASASSRWAAVRCNCAILDGLHGDHHPQPIGLAQRRRLGADAAVRVRITAANAAAIIRGNAAVQFARLPSC